MKIKCKCGSTSYRINESGRHQCVYCKGLCQYPWRLTLDKETDYQKVVKMEIQPSEGDGGTWDERKIQPSKGDSGTWDERKIILPDGKVIRCTKKQPIPISHFKEEQKFQFWLKFCFETKEDGGRTERVKVDAHFMWEGDPKDWASKIDRRYSLCLKGRLTEETSDGVTPNSVPCKVYCLELVQSSRDGVSFYGVGESLLEECQMRCAKIYGVEAHPARQIRKELEELVKAELNTLRPGLRCEVKCDYVEMAP